MLERAVVLVVAVAATAFLAAGFSAARAEDELARLQFRTAEPTAAVLRRAGALADRAGRVTSGQRRVLLLAQMRLRSGDAAGAAALLRGAVRREPANAEAWLGLSRAARAGDPELARRAAQRVRALVPPVPAP